eukprot:445064_1
MNERENSQWDCLKKFPFGCVNQFMRSHDVPFDSIIAVSEQKDWIFDEEEMETGDGIYTFWTSVNYWITHCKYPQNMVLEYHAATFDWKKRFIWIVAGKQLLRYKMNEFIWEVLMNDLQFEEFPISHMCVVNGTLHLINNKTHFIFDEITNRMRQIHTFTTTHKSRDWIGFVGNALMYLTRTNCLVLFERRNKNIIIHEYQLKKSLWTEAIIKLTSNAFNELLFVTDYGATDDNIRTSVISTTQNDFVFFVNGINGTIYVFNVETRRVDKCHMEPPDLYMETECHLTITRDEYVDEVIVYGWLRRNIKDVELPKVIQQWICTLVCNETLHWIEFSTGNHWGISVDTMIQSVEKRQHLSVLKLN